MKIAFVGKGGGGKSVVAGTVARVLARRGHPVLAVDSDPMPGLAFALGLAVTDTPIPDDAVVETPVAEAGPRYRLRPGLTAVDAIGRYALLAPDGIRFLQFGKVRGDVGQLARSQCAFRQIVDELHDGRWSVVGDLPGGTRQPFFGWGGYARTLVVVVEPSPKSLLSARRLARLALAEQAPQHIVAVVNKAQERSDGAMVRRRTGLPVIAEIPYDDAVAAADRRGAAPIDAASHSPAVLAIRQLASRLTEFDRDPTRPEEPVRGGAG